MLCQARLLFETVVVQLGDQLLLGQYDFGQLEAVLLLGSHLVPHMRENEQIFVWRENSGLDDELLRRVVALGRVVADVGAGAAHLGACARRCRARGDS